MSIRHLELTKSHLPSFDLWKRLIRLQGFLELSDTEMSKLMDISDNQFRATKFSRASLPAYSLGILLERLELDWNLFISGDLDYEVLARRLVDGDPKMPDRYIQDALGNLSTPKAFIDSFTAVNSNALSVELFRALQISPRLIKDPNIPVNMLFSLDILRHIQRHSNAKVFTNDFGKRGAMALRSKEFDSVLKESSDYKGFYEKIPFLVGKYIEKNSKYSLETLKETYCILKANPEEHMLKHSRGKINYLDEFLLLCAIRTSYLETFPKRIGWPSTKVTKLSCFFLGDHSCRFKIEFMPPSSFLTQTQTGASNTIRSELQV